VTALDGTAAAEDRLRDIQKITDVALSRLTDEQFLSELLARVKRVLSADTAALFLVDPSSRYLIASAAAGLEEEVVQGVRIPLGKGFAGRVAAERKPVILDRVDRTTVINPLLLGKGLNALLGVPMLAGGEVLGIMHVGSLTPRQFTPHEAELLQLAADRAAIAVQSMRAVTDRTAAMALQRSLLPTALPVHGDAELAARFIPGSGVVGGDWYDVFTLPSGELCLVIGDVAGSGLQAAVIMGRMRSALRAYAIESSDPADVLSRLDRKIQHFEPDALATVQYAVFDRQMDRVLISSAGHPPPVVAHADGRAELADIYADVMIGVIPDAPRRISEVPTPPGTMLCFYTDGLIERPERALDDGLALLCKAVVPQDAEMALAAVMASLIGTEAARDDIAVLMFRRRQPDGPA
jgi:phosphoserine phosphatase RsbU/P